MTAKTSEVDPDERLQHLDIFDASGLAVLDGGFATHLEDVLGQDISSSSLWSASLLNSEKGSKAIIQTHLAFLKAGADVISTSSYQASTLAFGMAGHSTQTAEQLLVKSVQLAQQARQDFARLQPNIHKPLLLLSLGPYGSALSNGSEYTGDYFVPDLGKRLFEGPPASIDDIENFHYSRLRTIASSPEWSLVDLIAFETIPRLDEAVAIRRALERLFKEYNRKVSYTSFVFPNGSHLPWPVRQENCENQDMKDLLKEVLGDDEEGQSSPLDGVGINCTKPKFLKHLVEKMTCALPHVKRKQRSYLFLYPDGGLVWDGIKRVWMGGTETATLTWSNLVMNAAESAMGKGDASNWAGCFVGGCCKATTADIAALRQRVDESAPSIQQSIQ